jgi:hypothetical protein
MCELKHSVLQLTTVGTIFPHYWTGVHLHEKSENFEWLKIMTSNLGYCTCISINNLRPTNSGLKISERVDEPFHKRIW